MRATIAPTPPHALRLGDRRYPVVLPSIRDPRLHLASVVLSIHVLGQVALGFQVSIVQILAAILTCAAIEIGWTFVKSRTIVWPASAMLTGSSVALIFRVVGTEHGDLWSGRGWYLFALVAGGSLLTKYVIRFRGSHVFNPSNVGLVVAFLVLGSARVEPLDFWWAPLDGWMAAAYLIILVGGLLITARLRLLGLSAAFWITLAAAVGVLAASGHCMTARWSFAPVCGSHFWWVIVTSPEVLIFLFFMITDPKTVPAGRIARIAFGASVALVGALLIAPQRAEFGTKVALLGSLVLLCAARPVFERLLPAPGSDRDRAGALPAAILTRHGVRLPPLRAFARGAALGVSIVVLGAGIVAAGAPGRESIGNVRASASSPLRVPIDRSAIPAVAVDPGVAELSPDLAGSQGRELAVTLAENLEIEAQALFGHDPGLLPAADDGDRLTEMRGLIADAVAAGETVVPHYTFDALRLVRVPPPRGQGGLVLGVEARGTTEEIVYNADGDRTGRTTSPFAVTFLVSRPTGDRWLIVGTAP